MKTIIITITTFLLGQLCNAQTYPGKLNVHEAFVLEVGHTVTTIITFPFPVKEADRGTGSLLAAKVPGVDNVIKVKAVQPFADTTTLHVFTADGRVHAFRVVYNPLPEHISYDWQDDGLSMFNCSPPVQFDDLPYNLKQLMNLADNVRQKKPFLYRGTRKFKMQLWLQGIYYDTSVIVASFKINNLSRLSYTAGLSELYLSDRKQSKRTSNQQLPVVPFYQDPLPTVKGFDHKQWILVIPKITVANNKRLQLTIREHNGGRNLKIEIRNKDILKAKQI